MKRNEIKICIIELIIIAMLSFALFVFNLRSRIILSVIVAVTSVIIWSLLKRKLNKSVHSKKVSTLFILLATIHIIAFYLMGLYFGFYDAENTFSISTILKYIIPTAIIIIASEQMRKLLVAQSFKFTKLFTLIIMVLIDMILYIDLYNINTYQSLIDAISFVFLASLASNYLFNYVSNKYGMEGIVFYRLITVLYMYIIPYIPNVHIFLRCVFRIVYPYVIYQVIEYTFSNKNEVVAVYDKRISSIITAIILVFVGLLAMLISCQFRFGALVIATTSMTGTLDKGDVIIYERFDNQEKIASNQIVVFKKEDRKIVHRIVGIKNINGKNRYTTKGDANRDNDKDFITDNEIVGLYKMKIDYIGYPSLWVRDFINKK